MTDIKQIYTSHQSLVGTVTPSVIRTVPFPLVGYAPLGKWYSPYNFGGLQFQPATGASVYICIITSF